MARWGNTTEEERYWAKVDRRGAGECWEWTAARNDDDYGLFRARGATALAHRYGWELANGEIHTGLCVLHHCDNPPCVNPAHLFLGTRLDNAKDRDRKSRQAKGERMGSAVLTEKVIRAANQRYRAGADIPTIARELGLNKATLDAVREGRS